MKLASFRHAGITSWGVVGEGILHDVGALLRDRLPDLKTAIAAGALQTVHAVTGSAPRLALDAVEWLPVIPNPDKILCIGLNYEEHRQETGRSVVGHPTIFTRFANSQIGHLAPLLRPNVSADFDYEGELAVIIGTSCRHVAKADAFDQVAAYACYNDASVRDWQRHTHQFTPGKNFVGTGAFGPWMVTPDEVGPLGALRLRTRVNDRLVQEATLGEMLFDIPTQIAYCSTFTRLEPGDVIATGTPDGVGAKRSPPLWLKPGDMVEVEIERVGLLRNPVVDEA
jgi:2-keto-4-pentenoate hydratase/2-oxohepta-3-ene-1,7-dioic acid hydratase in catechol pathway